MKTLQEYNHYFESMGISKNYLDVCLRYDWGKCIPVKLPTTMKEFLNSEYAEKEVLNRFSARFVENEKQEELKNEMVAQGITDYTNNYNLDMLFNCSKEFLQSIEFYYTVTALALYIDRKSAIDFLNKNASSRNFMEVLVERCGLNSRPSFYSGRGVVASDLNSNHLLAIYQKLERIDKEKAFAMAQMTLAIPTLGATEFLNSLYALAENNFHFEQEIINENNVDLNVSGDEQRNAVAFASLLGFNVDEERNIRATKNMKNSFLYDLPDEVEEKLNKHNRHFKQKRKNRKTL